GEDCAVKSFVVKQRVIKQPSVNSAVERKERSIHDASAALRAPLKRLPERRGNCGAKPAVVFYGFPSGLEQAAAPVRLPVAEYGREALVYRGHSVTACRLSRLAQQFLVVPADKRFDILAPRPVERNRCLCNKRIGLAKPPGDGGHRIAFGKDWRRAILHSGYRLASRLFQLPAAPGHNDGTGSLSGSSLHGARHEIVHALSVAG